MTCSEAGSGLPTISSQATFSSTYFYLSISTHGYWFWPPLPIGAWAFISKHRVLMTSLYPFTGSGSPLGSQVPGIQYSGNSCTAKIFFFLFSFIYLPWERVSLCDPGCPGTWIKGMWHHTRPNNILSLFVKNFQSTVGWIQGCRNHRQGRLTAFINTHLWCPH